jgi:hypothetical protein
MRILNSRARQVGRVRRVHRVVVLAAIAIAFASAPQLVLAQTHDHPILHVSDRWDDCAFQLNAALTRDAWRQFTREAAQVIYFRPLRDAAPMGAGRIELSMVQANVGIDDDDAAWNDTFVHPDSAHVLFEGSGLAVPGILGRVGVTDRVDAGFFFTKNPNSNYGVAAGQLQYNLLNNGPASMDAAVRASASTLFGPEDVNVTVYGVDMVVSRKLAIRRGISISPYVGGSMYLSSSSENSNVVDLRDERLAGVHANVGAVANLSVLRVAFEYDAAAVQSHTLKIGFGF